MNKKKNKKKTTTDDWRSRLHDLVSENNIRFGEWKSYDALLSFIAEELEKAEKEGRLLEQIKQEGEAHVKALSKKPRFTKIKEW